jgi:hypothetical protein
LAGLLLVLFEPTDHVLDFLKGQCLLGGDAALEHHLAVIILFLFETQLANRVLQFVYLLQSHLLVDVLDTWFVYFFISLALVAPTWALKLLEVLFELG